MIVIHFSKKNYNDDKLFKSPLLMNINVQLQQIFDEFNTKLFKGILGEKIPECVISLQRKNNMYSEMHHKSLVDLNTNVKVSEILLNPVWFGVKPQIEILQYLVHQMVHVYQHEFGEVSQSGKHDEQFLDFANAIGLMPSDTGLPDGKPLGGKKIMCYPMVGGAFLDVANELAEAGKLITWFELEKPRSFSVDSLVRELYEKKELLGGMVHQSLLHVPLLVSQKIDVDALLDCLKLSDDGTGVTVDASKASKIADDAIVHIRESAKENEWKFHTTNETSVNDDPIEPTVYVHTSDDAESEFIDQNYQVNTRLDLEEETHGDAADIFIKQAMANKLEAFEQPAHPGQQKVVKNAHEIAAALGLSSTACEPKKVVNKKEYKYTCSCDKSVKGSLGMSVICGHCQLHFMCETIEVEKDVVKN